jgi:hypothetical protein
VAPAKRKGVSVTNVQISIPIQRTVAGLLIPVVKALWAGAMTEPDRCGAFVDAWVNMRCVMERIGLSESFDLSAQEREWMLAAFALLVPEATEARAAADSINGICRGVLDGDGVGAVAA